MSSSESADVNALSNALSSLSIESNVNEVLELCKIPESINIGMMTEFINKYMESRVSYYREKKRSPFIEDEFSEFYTAKCSNGIEIGGGSCAMDVQTKENEGIDAICVIMNKNSSNEKSLIQNFSSSGVDLDTLFRDKKDSEAIELYLAQYLNKLKDVKNKKKLKELYILAFISTKNDVHMVCFKINLESIKNVTSGGFVKTKAGKADKNVNIIVNNFINPSYGNVKLYKSKKRIELRLLPAVLNSEHAVKVYSTGLESKE